MAIEEMVKEALTDACTEACAQEYDPPTMTARLDNEIKRLEERLGKLQLVRAKMEEDPELGPALETINYLPY